MTDAFSTPSEVKTEDLVGEGKKFANVDALAKAKVESDNFVTQLQTENAEMRAALGHQAELERQLAELRTEMKTARESANQPRGETSPALTVDAIKNLVTLTITEAEQKRSVDANVSEANNKLVKSLGTVDAARKAVEAKAASLGVSVDFLKGVAAKSPTAFLDVMGVADKAAPAGSFVTNSAPKQDNAVLGGSHVPGTYEYFESIRREKGKDFYFSIPVQQAIWDAKLKGSYIIPQK